MSKILDWLFGKKAKPYHEKPYDPYDLNSVYRWQQHNNRQRPKWVDWNDKPSPYDLNDRRLR